MLVKQVSQALDILEFFAERRQPATPSEIARHFGWPRSSTFNLVHTLVERGYLYEPKPREGYYPTPRWLAVAQQIAAAEPLPEALRHLLRDLAEQTGETVGITAASGAHAVFLEVIPSRYPIAYQADVGKQLPLHATASGQAILSQMPPAQVSALLRRTVFERYGEGTPMSVEEIETRIKESLARGWFASASAYTQDLGGIAVPLVMNERIYSLTVAGPLFRLGDRIETIAERMHEAVARHLGSDYFATNVPNLHRLPVSLDSFHEAAPSSAATAAGFDGK